VTDTIGHDGFGELASYRAAASGASVLEIQYARDGLGRIARKTETIGGITGIFDYAYDAAGRLSEVRKDGAVLSAYTYDANGNRLSGPSATDTYTYDAQDRLLARSSSTGTADHAHTAAGDLLTIASGGRTTTYRYDEFGALVGVTLPTGKRIDYVNDGQGRRVGKRVDGVPVQGFLYADALAPVAELDGSGEIVSRFVHASRINVPAYMVRAGVTYRIITDHLGGPRLVIDVATGSIAQRIDYDEFGKVIDDTNPGFQPFGFAGGLYDPDTGLTRFGARDYDAENGRWTAKDPRGFIAGPNLYAYADNDPVNFIDPLGDEKVDPWGSTAAGPAPIIRTVDSASDAVAFKTTRMSAEESAARLERYLRSKARSFYSGGWAKHHNGSLFPSRNIPLGTNQVSGELGGSFVANLEHSRPLSCLQGAARSGVGSLLLRGLGPLLRVAGWVNLLTLSWQVEASYEGTKEMVEYFFAINGQPRLTSGQLMLLRGR
jgi:RHS repeat-associated protein